MMIEKLNIDLGNLYDVLHDKYIDNVVDMMDFDDYYSESMKYEDAEEYLEDLVNEIQSSGNIEILIDFVELMSRR